MRQRKHKPDNSIPNTGGNRSNKPLARFRHSLRAIAAGPQPPSWKASYRVKPGPKAPATDPRGWSPEAHEFYKRRLAELNAV